MVEFYLKLRLILRIITYLTYICWEINNFVIETMKVIFLGDFSFVRIFLKNYRVTMTTTLELHVRKIQWFCQQGEGFCMHVFSTIFVFLLAFGVYTIWQPRPHSPGPSC